MLEKGVSSVDFRLSLNSDRSKCANFEVGGASVYLHGTIDEMRAFVDAVDMAVARAEQREALSLDF